MFRCVNRNTDLSAGQKDNLTYKDGEDRRSENSTLQRAVASLLDFKIANKEQ